MRFKFAELSTDEKKALAEDQNTSTDKLRELSYDSDPLVLRRVANHPNTDTETLSRLAKSESKYVRRAVARHENTSPKTLEYLYKTRDPEDTVLLSSLAFNKRTPPDLITEVVKLDDVFAQSAAANNPNTPIPILWELSKLGLNSVNPGIAANKSTPADLLEYLAGVETINITTAFNITNNPNTTTKVLWTLAMHPHTNIREQVALSEKTPLSILMELANDWEYDVSTRALATLGKKDLPDAVKPRYLELKKLDSQGKMRREMGPGFNLKTKDLHSKANTDLELLHRLKGYLK